MNIEKEEFDQWLGHPVTEWMMRAHNEKADEAKETWLKASWEGGNADPLLLADLRARAEVFRDFAELNYEDMRKHDEERERNSSE